MPSARADAMSSAEDVCAAAGEAVARAAAKKKNDVRKM
jgi:hypothetical protein